MQANLVCVTAVQLDHVSRFATNLIATDREDLGHRSTIRRASRHTIMTVATAASIHICRPRGLGDILMCTPGLRELKRNNPEGQIHFYTEFPELVRGLSYIDHCWFTNLRPPGSIWMKYENSLPSSEHLAVILGHSIGVRVGDVRPDCIVREDLAENYKTAWRDLPRPHILVQRHAGPWTPNKDWPSNHWKLLALSLLEFATVLEIGRASKEGALSDSPNYLDLRGNSIEELIACIAAADVLVAPDSGPIHIAAAMRTPTVVVMGGYLLPENTAYPGNKILHTRIHCSPCWLRTPCPIDRECLLRISPEMVKEAVMEIMMDTRNESPH